MNNTQILLVEMLQRYIRVLTKYFCMCLEILSRHFQCHCQETPILVVTLRNTNKHQFLSGVSVVLHGVSSGLQTRKLRKPDTFQFLLEHLTPGPDCPMEDKNPRKCLSPKTRMVPKYPSPLTERPTNQTRTWARQSLTRRRVRCLQRSVRLIATEAKFVQEAYVGSQQHQYMSRCEKEVQQQSLSQMSLSKSPIQCLQV